MTDNASKKNSPTFPIFLLILFLGAICLYTPGILLTHFNIVYLLYLVLAIVALTIAFSLPIRQRRITIYSIIATVFGIISLASSIIEFGYDRTIAPLSIDDQIAFSRVLQPQRIARGLMSIGMGIFMMLPFFINPKQINYRHLTADQFVSLFQFAIGIFLILMGLLDTVNGFYGA